MIRGAFFTDSLSADFTFGGCLDACSRTVRLAFSLVLAGWGSGLIAPGVFPCRGESAVYFPDNARAPAYDTAYSLYKKLYAAVKPLYNAF